VVGRGFEEKSQETSCGSRSPDNGVAVASAGRQRETTGGCNGLLCLSMTRKGKKAW